MTTSFRKLFVLFAVSISCLWAAPKKLYVEPFTTKTNARQLHDELVTEIGKSAHVSIVTSEANADAVLAGGGEIWVKGYRSLNPRSGRSPSDGVPVFGGYLSVELRDKNGSTVWSDLVTPGSGDGDVAKGLSRKIAKDVTAALMKDTQAAPVAPRSAPRASLTGAGATFPYPVYEKWFANYRRENPGVEIAYQAVGSEAGIRQLLRGEVDFAASDSPQAIHDLAPDEESKYLFFPAVAGAVVPIVNLPGFTGQISFTPEALAGIYSGKITRWNDPILRDANRNVRLPDLEIVVVHRSEGSGTSYAFTDFLSKTNPEWKDSVGKGLAPAWPVGRGVAGNDGVAKMVKELGGSIGYVEFIYALQNHLSYGKVRNRAGVFVEAGLESIEAAAAGAEMSTDMKVSITDAEGTGAYPISSFTWFVVPIRVADEGKRAALIGFLKWMLGPGQRQAAVLGYLALPRDVVSKEAAAIGRIH